VENHLVSFVDGEGASGAVIPVASPSSSPAQDTALSRR
jgi:hypothetical protein